MMGDTDKLFWKIHTECQVDCDAKEDRRVVDTMPSFEQMLHKALEEIERLQAELTATDKLFNLAMVAGNAAMDEIGRLQAEIKTLRDWRTPSYSPAQLQQFEDSCYVPPSQFIRWHHLPEVPEILDAPPYMTRVWGCYANTEICKPVKYSQGNGFFEFDNLGLARPVDIRAWHYLEEKAPPKPEGEVEALEFGGEVKNEN